MAKRRNVLITSLGIIALSGCTSNESSSENSNGGGTSDSESGNTESSDEESLESQYPDYYVIEESTKLVALSDIEANADSFSVTITGTIVNGSDTDYEYAQVEFGLYDDSGAKVGNAVDNISGLNAGQRWRYEAIGTSESAATWELDTSLYVRVPEKLPELDDSGTSNKLEQKGRTITDANSGLEVGSVLDLGSAGNVGVREGISYGLGLVVYIVGLLLITSVLSGVGITFLLAANGVNSGIITGLIGLFGFIIFLTSLVVFFSGIAGLQYKIIADGVSRGTNTE